MKKKIIIVLLAAVFATGCGNKNTENSKADTQTDDTETNSASDETDGTQSKADQIKYDLDQCVTLGDYSALEISLPNSYKVTKEQVEDYALSMAKYYAQPSYKDTDKTTVEEGDTVNIDYEGKKDGVPFEGGTDTGFNLTIGSDQFIDGFEDGLIGKNVGETVELNLTFPENYGGDLAGADVVFTVKINKIVEEEPFELTDEYVKSNLNSETVEDYKKNVKEYLKTQHQNDKEKDTRQAVINKLLEISEVSVPEELLEARVEDYIVQFTAENCSDGTSLADYLASAYDGGTEENFRADVTNSMKTNLETEFVLEAIANKEGIKLDEDEFKEYVNQQMEANNFANEEAFYKANGVNADSGEKSQRKVFVCNQALDMVISKADIKTGVTPE